MPRRVMLGLLLCIGILTVTKAQIPWSYYHKTDQILDFFKSASQTLPSLVRYEDIPDPDTQISLPVVTITDFSTGKAGKEVLLLVAGEHARELITSEIVLWLGALLTGVRGEEFAEWAATQPIQATAWKNGWAKGTLAEWGEHLLKKVVFKIIPVENIVGRKSVEGGSSCLRTNTAGVDLNRNWPYAWQQSPEMSDEYGGAKPLSEAESRIVKLVAETSRPQAFVNLHSGEWAMYVPWDSKKELAPNLPADTVELLEKMNTYCECMHGAAGVVAGYLAMGTSMDWMYNDQHVPYPLTFEVFGPDGLGKTAKGGHSRRLQEGEQAASEPAGAFAQEDLLDIGPEEEKDPRLIKPVLHRIRNTRVAIEDQKQVANNGCLHAFNPMSAEEYEETVARWVGSLLVLAEHLAAHPSAATSVRPDAEQGQLPEPLSPPSKQDLTKKGDTAVQRAHDFTVNSGGFQTGASLKLGRKGVDAVEELSTAAAGGSGLSSGLVVTLIVLGVIGGAVGLLWYKLGMPNIWEVQRARKRLNLARRRQNVGAR